MILVDTSVWVDHFRGSDPNIAQVLTTQTILSHPFVIGEIALGNPHDRRRVLVDLRALPTVIPARHSEVMTMIENDTLYGTGIQYVDAHLLSSARLTTGCLIWTRDRKMRKLAVQFGIAADLD